MYKVCITVKQVCENSSGSSRLSQKDYLTLDTLELLNKVFGSFREPLPQAQFANNSFVLQGWGSTPLTQKELETVLREQAAISLQNAEISISYVQSSFYAGT